MACRHFHYFFQKFRCVSKHGYPVYMANGNQLRSPSNHIHDFSYVLDIDLPFILINRHQFSNVSRFYQMGAGRGLCVCTLVCVHYFMFCILCANVLGLMVSNMGGTIQVPSDLFPIQGATIRFIVIPIHDLFPPHCVRNKLSAVIYIDQ